MATDWLATLKEHGDLANRVATDVPIALGDPSLTIDQASRLYRVVETGAQDFDSIVELMQEEDLDESFYEAADALEDIWAELSVATANKVRTMQGLAPIEIDDDQDEDE